jgi:NAD-dependent DNA ligase
MHKENPTAQEILDAIKEAMPIGQQYRMSFNMLRGFMSKEHAVNMTSLQNALSLMVSTGEVRVIDGNYWRAF